MIVRLFDPKDLDSITGIHERYFSNQFDMDDFLDRKALERVVITDDFDNIITAATLRLIPEVVAITNMAVSAKNRRIALLKLLESMQFIARTYGYNGIHCFPLTSEKWTEHLKDYGFRETKGKCLSMEV